MPSLNYAPVLDMGNLYILAIIGAVAGIFSFIVAVFLEARIAKNYFKYETRVRLKFSFFANIVSAILGIVYVVSGFDPKISSAKGLLIAFVTTIIVESIIWAILVKAKKQNLMKVIRFCFLGNLASYAVMIIPFVVWFLRIMITVGKEL